MDDFQPDDFAPDSGGDDFQADDFQPDTAQSPSLMSKAGSIAGKTMGVYNKYVEPVTPVGLLKRADKGVRSLFNRAGEGVAETLGEKQVNPYLAAGVGTAVSMAPDVAMTLATPQSALKNPAKPLFRSVSEPMAQRSLGLTKRFLNTPFARGKARQAAKVALDEGVIPFSGNATTALERAADLQSKSGQALGSMRESVGATPIDQVFDSIEMARRNATNGLRGGAWDKVHGKFDEAQETLLALLDQGDNVQIKDVERAKKLLGNTVNWVADNVSQETAKQISSAIESGVEAIMRSKGIDMTAYAAQKGLYGASKTMQKGLANEVAAQAGNNAVSLPTMVLGAGQLATGNVPGAAATIGLTEALRRRGAGFGARLFDEVGKRLPPKGLLKVPVAARSIFSSNQSNESLPVPVQHMLEPQNGTNGVPGSSYGEMAQPNNNRNKQQNQNNGNGNGEGLGDQKSSKGVITEAKAREYLKKAGGDKKKARQLALADGWEVR